MMHKASCNVEEVPYNFWGHPSNFKVTGWKVDDLNPLWLRLLGQSQLSNPSDLPCWNEGYATSVTDTGLNADFEQIRSCVLICTTGPMMFQKHFASKRANFLAMTHSWNGWAPTDRCCLSAWTRNPPCWRTRHWAARTWGHVTVYWQHCIC